MRRKIIQIAGSTQLVSLPRQWAKKHNLQRGQEVEVEEDEDKVTVFATYSPKNEEVEFDISNLDEMISRCISAYYKRGVGTLRITYSDSSLLSLANEAISKDTVGFEILEQGDHFSVIKHVSGDTTEFDSVLRRVFLLLNTMSDESVIAFQKKKYGSLKNLAYLEEANNRFTTACMRYLNTKGVTNTKFSKVGPLYYIVESLEQIADQYKYLCQHFANLKDEKVTIRKEVLQLFEKANSVVRLYGDLFYKFDTNKLEDLNKRREDAIETAHYLYKKKLNFAENWLIYHSGILTQKVFEIIDSLLVLRLP